MVRVDAAARPSAQRWRPTDLGFGAVLRQHHRRHAHPRNHALPDQQVARKNIVRVNQIISFLLQRLPDAPKAADIRAHPLLDAVDDQHIHIQAAPAQ